MTIVTTQAELNAAIREGVSPIEILSDRELVLDVYDPIAVWAHATSVVRADGSAIVYAGGAAIVYALGKATVHAWDGSTVYAEGAATVHASSLATVHARPHVAVYRHSESARIIGGTVLDRTQEPIDPAEWCAYHQVTVTDGIATVYKAVDDRWSTPRGLDYRPGSTPEAPDWNDSDRCGGGLHFSPSPIEAWQYHPYATRFVAVGVALETLRPIPDPSTPKCKAPRVIVPCREVDIDGNEVTK